MYSSQLPRDAQPVVSEDGSVLLFFNGIWYWDKESPSSDHDEAGRPAAAPREAAGPTRSNPFDKTVNWRQFQARAEMHERRVSGRKLEQRLLQLYEQEGPDFVQRHFRDSSSSLFDASQFSLVIVDLRRKIMTLATDVFGLEDLFWFRLGHTGSG